MLVLPSGSKGFYKKALEGLTADLSAFVARGGKILGWGAGAASGVLDLQKLESADAVIAELRRLAAR